MTASLLLGLLGALLGCATGTAAADILPAATHAADGAGRGAGIGRGEALAGGAAGGRAPAEAVGTGDMSPAAVDPAPRSGCGKRTGGEGSGAHPGVPPRGGSAYELLPALHQAHGPAGSALVCDQAVPAVTPLRGPPPLAPPSAVDLSVLRV
ncbi:hypothetical protein J7E88_30285 [Streptomyces sp. ISL-10]|uniref:hypothetical protein n=1 Tax=Streptomyces sp. ISL-10 TaxID=2819172 RepID=UPI001BE7BBA9|nr:hypothetical protein [Streptomyces sp. ISL-10]MBT2369453.1 hypothetical protein [Streptomyces sp. ISL-10]